MLYLERQPSIPLRDCVRSLWYVNAPHVEHQRERVLPNGWIQIVISLGSDSLTDCGTDSGEEHLNLLRPLAPAILVGARARYEVIHMRDMKGLIGVIFQPGGFGPWLRQRAELLFETSV